MSALPDGPPRALPDRVHDATPPTPRRGARLSTRIAKRVLDLLLGSLLLASALPVLVVLGAAVALTSRGPVFFRQVRVGRDGRPFVLWKLRSMRVGAEDELTRLRLRHGGTGPLFKLVDDPRVTRVGRFLRRSSLDELPQLAHVVLGQMSLVGPRPALPEEVAVYQAAVHRRLDVRPGLTGLWQVSGRSDLTWEQSISLDLRYVEQCSLRLDLMILLRTGPAVLRGRGAY